MTRTSKASAFEERSTSNWSQLDKPDPFTLFLLTDYHVHWFASVRGSRSIQQTYQVEALLAEVLLKKDYHDL